MCFKVHTVRSLGGPFYNPTGDNTLDIVAFALYHFQKFRGLGIKYGSQCSVTVASIDDYHSFSVSGARRLFVAWHKRIVSPNDYTIITNDAPVL